MPAELLPLSTAVYMKLERIFKGLNPLRWGELWLETQKWGCFGVTCL